jgi:molybdenum cofactor biosynthesis enzyme MoaA
MRPQLLPERLNLAIARRCDIACPGCYTYFGHKEPDLDKFVRSVAAFVRLGLKEVTLSGGDPLTIAGLANFLTAMKMVGVLSIKVDTVGVGLVGSSVGRIGLRDLAGGADYIGIPVDGWSDESTLKFRRGRDRLFTETIELLDALDSITALPKVVVNTVAHAGNWLHLDRIHATLISHRCVSQWNIFQYTPTDQAVRAANQCYSVTDEAFERCREHLFGCLSSANSSESLFGIHFRSNESRLGQYLLINSEGNAWLPDEGGRTLILGSVFGREEHILNKWGDVAGKLLQRRDVLARSPTLPELSVT